MLKWRCTGRYYWDTTFSTCGFVLFWIGCNWSFF